MIKHDIIAFQYDSVEEINKRKTNTKTNNLFFHRK